MNALSNFIKNKAVSERLSFAALAGIALYGLYYLSTLMWGTLFSNSAISIGVFAVLYCLIQYTYSDLLRIEDTSKRKKRFYYSAFTAFLFSVSLVMGYQLKTRGMMDSGFLGKGLILLHGLCITIAMSPFANLLFRWFERVRACIKEDGKPWKNSCVFVISWLSIFLCWLPVFLAYYPSIMSHDFHRQSTEAARGFIWFNSYQPLAHTWLIWVALQIGYAVDNLAFGMACYSIFQMLVFSGACAYSAVTTYRLVKKKLPVILLLIFFGCFPLISVLSVTATKDVLFSALFLIYVTLFVERTFLCASSKRWILDIVWVLEGCVMILFRNNALYAVAVFAVLALLLAEKKQKIYIFCLLLVTVLGGKGGVEGVQLWIGTEGRGSKIEMFSVPLQTFSRVGYYHEENLDEETRQILERYIRRENWVRYTPAFADSVKGYVGQFVYEETWKNHIPEMLLDWVKVGLKYPNEYIDAFLLLNNGYWFIDDVTWSEVFGVTTEYHMGALSTYMSSVSDAIPEGIPHESKIPALKAALEEIVCGNSYYHWPILSVLFKPALYSWGILIMAIACIYNGNKKKLMIVLLPMTYLATMFLGPVVQARYILPIMMVVPLMIAVWAAEQ